MKILSVIANDEHVIFNLDDNRHILVPKKQFSKSFLFDLYDYNLEEDGSVFWPLHQKRISIEDLLTGEHEILSGTATIPKTPWYIILLWGSLGGLFVIMVSKLLGISKETWDNNRLLFGIAVVFTVFGALYILKKPLPVEQPDTKIGKALSIVMLLRSIIK